MGRKLTDGEHALIYDALMAAAANAEAERERLDILLTHADGSGTEEAKAALARLVEGSIAALKRRHAMTVLAGLAARGYFDLGGLVEVPELA